MKSAGADYICFAFFGSSYFIYEIWRQKWKKKTRRRSL